MTWDQALGNWSKMRPLLRHRWGRLSEEDLDGIAGSRELFVAKVGERYGLSREEARERIEEWLESLREGKVFTGRA